MADNDFMTGYVAGQNEGGRGGNGGFMDGAGSWVWILVIFALLFGWGGNSGWNSGNSGGGASMVYPYIGGIATRADINEGFALNNITGGITAIQQGICDSTYALNNTINNGFFGVDRSLCNGFNNLSSQLAQCCCDNRAAIADLKYTIATEDCATRNLMQNNTRDIIESQNAGTRAVLDFLVQEKMATKDATIADLRMQVLQNSQNAFITANQQAQTAELIRRLGADCPAPAYLVQPPTPINFPTNGCGTVQFGNRVGNCGCGNNYAYAA